ncbi:MAG: hypothetical protein Q9220_003918 [cf. Caloplaca sp. 1 TL-2023]
MAQVMDAAQPNAAGSSFGFESIFTIAVGPQHQVFLVHEFCLRKSPVFACMCNGNFIETSQRHITFPEDDPARFATMVDFLYTGQIWSNGFFIGVETSETKALTDLDILTELAHLYIMADKYALDAMKRQIVVSMTKHTRSCLPTQWLAVAETIYSSLPKDHGYYPMYLKLLLYEYLDSVHGTGSYGFELSSLLKTYIEKGGQLALEISQSLLNFGLEVGIKLPQQGDTKQGKSRANCWVLLED